MKSLFGVFITEHLAVEFGVGHKLVFGIELMPDDGDEFFGNIFIVHIGPLDVAFIGVK